jgi:aryl-alcohol dehydrogenase-like predicted oxidoreductase
MSRSSLNRRQFLESTAVLAGAVLFPTSTTLASPPKRTAVDQVLLGNTGVRLSRLGIGTGTNSGQVQRALGREGFDRLIRYAYDQGITYIDTAESYHTHEYIREAIKGLPREKLYIQTKMPGTPEKPAEVLDRYRRELGIEYFDCVLSHYATTADWDDQRKRVLDALQEAKEKKILRAKGVSCHGLPALRRATAVPWVDVQLVRLNPQGRHIDGPSFEWNAQGYETTLADVTKEIQAMRAQGRGIIGMKLIGNGDFKDPAQREKSIRYAMGCGLLDAAVIGFATTAEIDEAIQRMNRALAEA